MGLHCKAKKKKILSLTLMALGMFSFGNMVTASEVSGKTNLVYTLEGVTVEAKRPDWESKLSPGTVTVIRPEKYKGEQKTLADLLKDVPGVHVREVNGKGQYTTVSVRGSTAAQVGVFVDGVMTNLGGDAAVDISTIPVKNVERIEVYRGYIPSRFGGTFIGGVINVVTKKPGKAHIAAELGKSSFGGKNASLEVTAPAGRGSLLAAINYETSDGDFPYYNYAVSRGTKDLIQSFEYDKDFVGNFNKNQMNDLIKQRLITLSDEQKSYYETHENEWLTFVRGEGLTHAIEESIRADAKTYDGYQFIEDMQKLGYWDGFKNAYAESQGETPDDLNENDLYMGFAEAWKDSHVANGYVTDDMKNKVIAAYTERKSKDTDQFIKERADPERSKAYADHKESLELNRKKIKASYDGRRHRRYNDRKNMDTLIDVYP